MNYSKLYRVLFNSICVNDQGLFVIDGEDQEQIGLLKDLFRSMNDTITTKTEDVIQTVDVLEYMVEILSDIKDTSLLKFLLKLMLEILKGDFIIKGERPFKCFFCVVFYL